ncbi:hypothetical protein [Streptomyces sp. HM190]|uniref:hypothetical protein n=1 Tax=Streptomyces sp. HM190 TaxID=2695266 RepID=UPI00135778B9|nr:hypothetical protein [Streptomyces sp. HM190]
MNVVAHDVVVEDIVVHVAGLVVALVVFVAPRRRPGFSRRRPHPRTARQVGPERPRFGIETVSTGRAATGG